MEQKCVPLGHLLVMIHSDHKFRLTVIYRYWYIAQWA